MNAQTANTTARRRLILIMGDLPCRSSPGSPAPQIDKPADSRSVPLAATSVLGKDWHYHGVALEPTPTYTNRLQCVECGRVSREDECGWTAVLGIVP